MNVTYIICDFFKLRVNQYKIAFVLERVYVRERVSTVEGTEKMNKYNDNCMNRKSSEFYLFLNSGR